MVISYNIKCIICNSKLSILAEVLRVQKLYFLIILIRLNIGTIIVSIKTIFLNVCFRHGDMILEQLFFLLKVIFIHSRFQIYLISLI